MVFLRSRIDSAVEYESSISVIGVNAEAEKGVDFYWLPTAHGRTKFPALECCHNFGGHSRRAGLVNSKAFQIARSVEDAGNDHTRAGKSRREIGAQALRTGQAS